MLFPKQLFRCHTCWSPTDFLVCLRHLLNSSAEFLPSLCCLSSSSLREVSTWPFVVTIKAPFLSGIRNPLRSYASYSFRRGPGPAPPPYTAGPFQKLAGYLFCSLFAPPQEFSVLV
ncbi:hypothetical protein NMG60_11000195 [Bertholletia excelsa]